MWGILTSIDLKACDKSLITKKEVIVKFAKELVELLQMKMYGDPVVVHFGERGSNKAGFTLVQLIETSCITAHFCDETGDVYIDIFSCKPYSYQSAAKMCKTYFCAQSMTYAKLDRG